VVKGTAGGRHLKATFENVFDFGLIVRAAKGTVYRHQDGTWRRMQDDRPLDNPALEDLLEWEMPLELRLLFM